jgi:hypothetical protein
LQIAPTKMLVALMLGASDFTTPHGHQTNLMVMSSGAYRFADYQRLGLPFELFLNIVQLTCIHYYDQFYITIPCAVLFFALAVSYDRLLRNKRWWSFFGRPGSRRRWWSRRLDAVSAEDQHAQAYQAMGEEEGARQSA